MQARSTKLPVSRREFLGLLGAGSVSMALPGVAFGAVGVGPQDALVFDAMGEMRPVYGPDLVSTIRDSGLNAITVTLCDPKTFEAEATQVALEGIREYDEYLTSMPDHFVKATSFADLERARREGKIAVFYLFQNSTPIGRDLDLVPTFYSLGVRSVQITYNYQNWAGAGCKERTDAGLTRFGLDLVAALNESGILVDLSHANMATMADAIRASKTPVIVSHTACMAVHGNERNTTDDNLRLLAEHGGVVGICQIRPFITSGRDGAFQRYLDHIVHAIDIAGIDHVGIGSDRDHRVITMTEAYMAELRAELGPLFNEDDWPLFMDELNGPRRMEAVWDGLAARGLQEADLEKVMGLNVARIYKEVVG